MHTLFTSERLEVLTKISEVEKKPRQADEGVGLWDVERGDGCQTAGCLAMANICFHLVTTQDQLGIEIDGEERGRAEI